MTNAIHGSISRMKQSFTCRIGRKMHLKVKDALEDSYFGSCWNIRLRIDFNITGNAQVRCTTYPPTIQELASEVMFRLTDKEGNILDNTVYINFVSVFVYVCVCVCVYVCVCWRIFC